MQIFLIDRIFRRCLFISASFVHFVTPSSFLYRPSQFIHPCLNLVKELGITTCPITTWHTPLFCPASYTSSQLGRCFAWVSHISSKITKNICYVKLNQHLPLFHFLAIVHFNIVFNWFLVQAACRIFLIKIRSDSFSKA